MRSVASMAWAAVLMLGAACGEDGADGSAGGPGGAASGGTTASGGSPAGGAGAAGSGSGGSVATGGRGGAGGTTSSGGATATGGASSSGGTGGARTGGAVGGAVGGAIAGGAGGRSTGGTAGAGIDGGGGDAGPLDGSAPDGSQPIDGGPDGAVDATIADRPDGPGDRPAASGNTCLGPASAALANAALPPGYCAWTWASSLSAPRGIARNDNGDLLVVEQNANRITLLHDDDGNGVSDSNERVVLTTASGLNHGIALHAGYLYASSATTVFRWAYTGGRQPLGSPQTVVSGIPSGGHTTRTLMFDREGNLYVSVGSQGNIDTNIVRARIVRYPAARLGSASTFAEGEAFATGLRNEVGLTLDSRGRIWGVENGSDNLMRSDLGGDIHNDNPGEELNLFAEPGRFYGYPYCWTEYQLPASAGKGRGTQWADPSTMNDGTHSDAWCQNPANVVPPALVMQAHSAPLDIEFYAGGAFPPDMDGTAIVTFHGSWNRSPATGYKVVRIPFGADGMPAGDPTPFLEFSGSGDNGTGWPHRPVGIETGVDGRLYVTSDASSIVIAIGHDGT